MQTNGRNISKAIVIQEHRAPGASDDHTHGLLIGAEWIDYSVSPPNLYICLDTSTGAAVWLDVSAVSSDITDAPNDGQAYARQSKAWQAVGSHVGGTVTTSQPALNLSQTWNNPSMAFTAALVNAIVTADNGSSLLLELQTNSTDVFTVDELGNAIATGNLTTNQALAVANGSTLGGVTQATGALNATGGVNVSTLPLTVTSQPGVVQVQNWYSTYDTSALGSTQYATAIGQWNPINSVVETYGGIYYENNGSRVGWVNIAQFTNTGWTFNVPATGSAFIAGTAAQLDTGLPGLSLNESGTIAWSSTANYFNTKDTGLSRSGVGIVSVGNGTVGDSSGEIKSQYLNIIGPSSAISINDRTTSTVWELYSQGGSFGLYNGPLGMNSVTVDANGCVLLSSGTITSNDPALTVTQTWNNAAASFTSFLVNTTDTADAGVTSLLMDLQIGGVSQCNVNKFGTITTAGNITTTGNTFLMIGAAGSVLQTGGTVTANTPMLSITQTWNNAAVAFTGIISNITDTASASGSRLLDLQVGSATKLNVDQFGNVQSQGNFYAGNLTAYLLGTGQLQVNNPTVTANTPMLNLSQTWNNAGVVFDGTIVNITNTASAVGSSFATYAYGGISFLRIVASVGSVAAPTIRTDGGNLVLNAGSGNQLYLNNDVGTNIVCAGNLELNDAINVIFGTTTGSVFGATNLQKQAWWGATPVVQSTGFGTPVNATLVPNFDGSAATASQTSGMLAYVVQVLKSYGLFGA